MNLGQNYASSNDPNLYRRNVNQNLVGMNTQFMNNSINGNRILQNKNEYENAMVENNVLPHPGLKSTLINRPYKLVLYKNVSSSTADEVFTLNESLNDVVSVKLENCLVHEPAAAAELDFILLSINELNNNLSDNDSNNAVINNSFATLNYDQGNLFKNDGMQNDIKYFDPPLNNLNKLTFKVSAFQNSGTSLSLLGTYKIKLELTVETKEKLRVY
jgi:hypothetical protein